MFEGLFTNFRKHEKGNVATVLFGSVAMVGVISAATMQMISGPIRTASMVNNKNLVESQLIIGAKVIALSVDDTDDLDADGTVEPPVYDNTAAPKPTGGGGVPAGVGAAKTDPWNTNYGYCVWDNGNDTIISPGEFRLAGENDPNALAIALISAGPNRQFETTCSAGPGAAVTKAVNSDDYVFSYTYAEAAGTVGGLWEIGAANTEVVVKSGATETVRVDKATGNLTASGVGDFFAVVTDLITAKTGNTLSIDASAGVASSGNITIGTFNNPRLWLSNDAGTASTMGVGADSGTGWTGTTSDSPMTFLTNSTEKMRILSNGNVGIGQPSPLRKLTVQGSAVSAGEHRVLGVWANGNESLALGYDANGSVHTNAFLRTHNNLPLHLGAYAAPSSIVIKNDGNVGISTANALAPLHVNGGSMLDGLAVIGRRATAYDTKGYEVLIDANAATPPFRTDVNGAEVFSIAAAGTVKAAGEIISTNANAFRMVQGNFGTFLRNDGTNTYLLITASGSQYGSWNALRPFTVNNTSGYVTIGNGATVDSGLTVNGGFTLGSGNLTLPNTLLLKDGNPGNGVSKTAGLLSYDDVLYFRRHTAGTDAYEANVATINLTNGDIATTGALRTANYLYGASNKEVMRTSDTWLRLNNAGDFTNGVYTPGLIRADAGLETYGTLNMHAAAIISDAGVIRDGNGGWVRTYGSTGWFNGTYGGGFYMTDSTWVRAYNSKSIWTPATVQADTSVRTATLFLTSDERFKKDITPIEGALDQVTKLQGVNYHWDTSKDRVKNMDANKINHGLIAQDVEKVYPELVSTDEGGMKSVEYTGLIAPLIEAVKELKARNEALEKRLELLENK